MDDDKIIVECPDCGKQYQVPRSAAGKSAKCSNCGRLIPIPADPYGDDTEAPAPEPGAAPAGLPPEMVANRAVAGRMCPVCNQAIDFGQNVRNCELCGATHHQECWQSHGGCGTDSCANAPLPKLAGESQPQALRDGGAPPEGEMKACPYCGERILKTARKCRYCGEFLRGKGGVLPGRSQTCSEAKTALTLGIVSFFCCGIILGPLAIWYASKAKKIIAAGHGTYTGGGMATAGFILGIISTILNALVLLVNLASM